MRLQRKLAVDAPAQPAGRVLRVFLAAGIAALLAAAAGGQKPVGVPPKPLGPVPTQAADTTPAPASSPDTHALTADDLGAYFDGILPQQLKRNDIAGAVVLVVKDGNVLFQKGYGYADVAGKIPMSPGGTIIRPGSTSKLFTWTAVMQQVEQGKIDLDRDVNDYLDFKIPATYAQPITMRNLMTHTAGFEEVVRDLIVSPKRPPQSIGEYLRTHIPQRIFPPGTTPAYSNYGATLAGYIVQRVSGVPFDQYVQQNIFGPLDMQHTTFDQPLPAAWQPMMSKGYIRASMPAKGYEFVGAVPAGSAATTAVDESHFMFAHLGGGEWNGARILKPETVALMHSAQFAVDPPLEHMCLGFYEETRNGHRIIGHAGDTQFFHTDLHLIPDANIGFFVSYNSVGRGEISPRTVLFQSFLNRYFPYTIPPAPSQPNAAADARSVAGSYISSRRGGADLLSFFWMLGEQKVVPGPDGTLVVDSMKSESQVPKSWQEIGPLLYREKDGQDRIGFTKASDGQMILSQDFPFEVSMRVGLLDSKGFNLLLIVFVVIVALLTIVFWPVSFFLRRHYVHPLDMVPAARRWRLAIRLVVLLELAYLLCWLALLGKGQPLFDATLDPTLRAIQLVGWLATLGTPVVLYALARTWRSLGGWRLSRAGNVVIAFSALCFSWFLFHWHLLHFSILY